ncbi:MAG: (2Fe-2S)-binding protein [Pseudobacteriovorax sp.]|nr:(2Fe-2S)-binding protein [Pseudobacteriovorax sp.]
MTKITVNGVLYTVGDDINKPLLRVLRDTLRLTGTKYGCGKGLCGACTVHVAGVAVRSCQIPLGSVVGQKVITIEQLAKDRHPLISYWVKNNVPQCGFCQSGQLMSAANYVASKNAKTSDIDDAMSGNLCRCGSYPRIKSALSQYLKQQNA